MKMVAQFAIAATMVLTAGDSLFALADADRQQFDVSEHPYIFYLSFEAVPDLEKHVGVNRFIIGSTSQQRIAERFKPAKVGELLYRIDLRELKWEWRQWWAVMQSYPYHPGKLKPGSPSSGFDYLPPLVVRADWLLSQLADTTESDARYRLLYGSTEFDRDDFRKLWGDSFESAFDIGFVEGKSGVSVQLFRWLRNHPVKFRNYLWGTNDFLKLNAKTDPLENIDYGLADWEKNPRHDGEEWIAGMPKFSLKTRESGCLQDYLLSDKDGKRVEEAPGRLVTDHTKFRGHAAIVNFGSCVACHPKGINPVTVDAYLDTGPGVREYANNKELKEKLETFLQPITKLIENHNDSYAIGVKITNGWEPEENASNFVAAVDWYDSPVTREQAAKELWLDDEDDLKLVLSYASANGYHLGRRLSDLAEGKPMPRTVWEDLFQRAYEAVVLWEQK